MKLLLCLKSLYQKVANDVFLKILIVFIIAISIPAICISSLLLKFSADNIIRQVGTSTGNLLSVKTGIIDQKFSEMDNLVRQLIFNKNIEYIEESEETNFDKPIIMYDIIQLLKEMVNANELIDSIYYYDDSNDFVLTDTTKYTKLDFSDRGILDINFNGERCAVYRKSKNLLLQEKDVISYITKFKYLTNKKTTYFVINLDYKVLFLDSIQSNLDTPMELLIFDDNKNIIFTSNNDFIIPNRSNLDSIMKTDVQNPVINIDGIEYFVSKTYTQKLNWTITYIQPYSNIVQTAGMLQRLSIPLSAVVLLLSFAIAYIFTVYLYKPMGKLILEVEKYTGVSLKKENAYSAINEILKNTFKRYNELLFKYQFAFPYFRQHLVNEILDEESFNIERFKEALTLIDINFKFSKYVTVLIDCENIKFTTDIEAAIKTYLFKARRYTAFLLSKIQDTRVVIIFNTDKGIEEIYSLLSGLKKEFNENSIQLTISLGQMYDALDKMCKSINDVLKQMENKFFYGKNEIIYNNHKNNTCSRDNTLVYDKCMEENLIDHIKSQDYDLAIQTLNEIVNSVIFTVTDIENIRYVYFQLAISIANSMFEIGIELPESRDSGMYVIEAIKKAETNQELLDFLSDLILKYIMLIKDLKKIQHTNLVAKTINFIENNYQREITQDDVSANVYLSPRHLNNLFKAETNMTIVEYITKLRMEKSREIIMNENKKVKDVAFAVGYNNIQTFLRLFKKFFGMTPVQYKRNFS